MPPGVVQLTPASWARHLIGWVDGPEADRLFALLQAELAWEQREVVIYGRRVLQPRLVAWAGILPYRYSGQTLEPRPATPTVAEVLARVNDQTGGAFNHVLVNRYRDGRDSMGFHADDEPELGDDPLVASLSFGAVRRMVVKPRRKSAGESRAFRLGPGDLFVMGGRFQAELHHGVPREAGATGERISLTFRRLVQGT